MYIPRNLRNFAHRILNAILYWKMCTFCVVFILFYNKMIIKPQKSAKYGRNNSIIFFPFEWASCPIARARRLFWWCKTPFVPQTVTLALSPTLKKLLLESNAEVFLVLLYLYLLYDFLFFLRSIMKFNPIQVNIKGDGPS